MAADLVAREAPSAATEREASPLAPPRIDRRGAMLANRLARRIEPAVLAAPGGDLRVGLCLPQDARAPDGPCLTLAATCDGHPLRLLIGEAAAVRLAALLEPELSPLAVEDEELLALLVEAIVEPALSRLEAWTGARIELARIGRAAEPEDGLEVIGVEVETGAGLVDRFALHLPAPVLDRLLERIDTLPSVPADADGLGMTIAFRKGTARLSLAELRSLAPGDVVLTDEMAERSEIKVIAAERWLLSGRLDRQGIRITAAARRFSGNELETWTMSKDTRSAGTSGESSDEVEAGLDDLPVTLLFELGRQEITLGELRSMGPGAVMALGREPGLAVDIYAQGKRIGQGDIVQIEDQIGVRVKRLFGDG